MITFIYIKLIIQKHATISNFTTGYYQTFTPRNGCSLINVDYKARHLYTRLHAKSKKEEAFILKFAWQ